MPFPCHVGLSAVAKSRREQGSECTLCLSLLLLCVFYFCFTPSWLMKVEWLLGFPFSLPLPFPFAGSHAFLAQSCCVWALICQAVINSKKNLFLLNYFQNVKQTCLNYEAANSSLRSGFDFTLIQVGERKKKTKNQNAEMPSFTL